MLFDFCCLKSFSVIQSYFGTICSFFLLFVYIFSFSNTENPLWCWQKTFYTHARSAWVFDSFVEEPWVVLPFNKIEELLIFKHIRLHPPLIYYKPIILDKFNGMFGIIKWNTWIVSFLCLESHPGRFLRIVAHVYFPLLTSTRHRTGRFLFTPRGVQSPLCAEFVITI